MPYDADGSDFKPEHKSSPRWRLLNACCQTSRRLTPQGSSFHAKHPCQALSRNLLWESLSTKVTHFFQRFTWRMMSSRVFVVFLSSDPAARNQTIFCSRVYRSADVSKAARFANPYGVMRCQSFRDTVVAASASPNLGRGRGPDYDLKKRLPVKSASGLLLQSLDTRLEGWR